MKDRLETLHILPKDAAYSVKGTVKDAEKHPRNHSKDAQNFQRNTRIFGKILLEISENNPKNAQKPLKSP